MPPSRIIEFYSGIGGLHEALKQSSLQRQWNAQVVAAFEWDPNAAAVYEANYGKDIVHKKDISTLQHEELELFEANMWLASPACQPYTVLGLGKGAADPRAASFLHLMNVVLKFMVERNSHPKYILVENVAGFESSDTRTTILNLLQQLGYYTKEFLLTPKQYGIPNSRLRYYLIARTSPFADTAQANTCLYRIPTVQSQVLYAFQPTPIFGYLDDIVDESTIIPDRVLSKWGRLFDIVRPSEDNSCCFTRGYTHFIEGTGSILQTNETLETSKVFSEFLDLQQRGVADAVMYLRPLGLRYFSPEELLRLFHISTSNRTLIWPPSVTRKTRYRLIGNSVNVAVVARVIAFLGS